VQLTVTLGIFALTVGLVFLRPKGLNEAWFTVGGGLAMLLLGLETPAQAWKMVLDGKDSLLFLVGLLLLAELMQASGFFEWASIHAARAAQGNGKTLFRNVFLLGAVVTALLSLDTTAVMLTPVVMAFVTRLKLEAKPFLFACAFVANTGSLLLQVSNLTNLLFAGAFHWSFFAFTLRMALPQILVLALNLFLFRWLFRSSLPDSFQAEELPKPGDVVRDEGFFRTATLIFLAVILGYFVGAALHVPPYVFAISGAVLLLGVGLRAGWVRLGIVREISWSVFPFVIGLFVVIRAMENLGLTQLVGRGFAAGGGSKVLTVLIGTFGAGVGSNVVNNIPMALLSISSLRNGGDLIRYAALIGCNIGPNLTVAGSLATMLVITSARKRGEDVGAKDFFVVGLKVTPALLLAGALGLLVSFSLLR
jgi:arsenical pump membrane protein